MKAKPLPVELIVSDYLSGLSVLQLSKKYDVARSGISKRLQRAGVKLRNQSEANVVSMGAMTVEQRKKRAEAANKALRGAKQPESQQLKRAIWMEKVKPSLHYGLGEVEFAQLLTNKGIDFVWQKAVGIYSLDFLVGSVAVEFKASMRHDSADLKRGRIGYIRDRGIVTLYVIIDSIEDLEANSEYILHQIEQLNKNLPPVGKYWVIRSRIDRFELGHNELGQFKCTPCEPVIFASCREFDY